MLYVYYDVVFPVKILENKDSVGKPKEFVLKYMSYEFKVSWLPIKFPQRQSHSLIYSRLKRRK
jgi:hypothetical protein